MGPYDRPRWVPVFTVRVDNDDASSRACSVVSLPRPRYAERRWRILARVATG